MRREGENFYLYRLLRDRGKVVFDKLELYKTTIESYLLEGARVRGVGREVMFEVLKIRGEVEWGDDSGKIREMLGVESGELTADLPEMRGMGMTFEEREGIA
jgi:hypothetical protein